MAKSLKETYKELFGEDLKREAYKMEAHVFVHNSRVGKGVCRKCGLVALNNDFSSWSIRMGCYSEEHPSYESKRKSVNNWF
jgi:hypothetical protein